MILLTTSKKRIYTIKPGTYPGSWCGYFCWLEKNGKIFERIETKINLKGRAKNVIIIIDTPKCFIYEKEKINRKTG